jgi:hypothetical protein
MHASRFSLAQIGAGAALLVVGVFAAYRLSTPASAENGVRAANVAVNCEPTQQAVIRQMVGKGDPLVSVECVTTGAAMTPAAFDQYGRAIGAAYVPAVYNVPADAGTVYAPAPRVVRSAAPVRRASTTSARVGEPKRSWQKTALIIGGSTGAGAGIGGLIGGKKGALIGAAVGGGSASIFEAMKR